MVGNRSQSLDFLHFRQDSPPSHRPRQPAKGSPGESTQFGQTRKRNAPQRVLTKFILGPISAHFQGPSDGPGADFYGKTQGFCNKAISFWDCRNFVLGLLKFRYGCFFGGVEISLWVFFGTPQNFVLPLPPNFVLTPPQISLDPLPKFR